MLLITKIKALPKYLRLRVPVLHRLFTQPERFHRLVDIGVPMVILKKQTSKILTGDVFQTNITSFTKGTSYELTLSQNYIQPDDVVLVIDDFLANGEAATGATRLVEMGGARIAGIAILIEKAFQRGRKRLEDNGYEVRSLARVSKLGRGLIEFTEADL